VPQDEKNISGYHWRVERERRREDMTPDLDHFMIDIADDTVIYAPTSELIAIIREESTWVRWWPGLRLEVYGDRGDKGLRWTVSGSLVGSSEIWLESIDPASAGAVATIVHYYLRANPTRSGSAIQSRTVTNSAREQREIHKLRERHVVQWKRTVWALKDSLENPNV
jgi:hypothetical protein